jgi:hypothetical protein
MSYYGDIALGSTIDIAFTTRRFSTGAPHSLAGSPAVAAYVDQGTTEITTGITLTTDFDGRTGLNHVRVIASAGNGFATGTNVQLVITAGTVDGVSVVGELIGSFSIEHRSAIRPTVAGRTLDVSAGGEAGVDWANVGSPTSTVGLSGTTVKTATDVETDTADIQSRIGTAGAGLTSIPWNAAWDAEVQSEVDDALNTAIAELGVGQPSATPTLRTAVMLLYMALRNRLTTQTSGTDALEIYNDAGTLIAKKLLTDDGADYTEAKMVSG